MTTVDDVTAGGERRRERCGADGAARTGVQWRSQRGGRAAL